MSSAKGKKSIKDKKSSQTKEITSLDTALANLDASDKKSTICPCCGKNRHKEDDYYNSFSILYKNNNSKIVICKLCVVDLFTILLKKHEDSKLATYTLCRYLDMCFDYSLFSKTESRCVSSGDNLIKLYIKAINSLQQYKGKTFEHSDKFIIEDKNVFDNYVVTFSEDDKKNKDDVIRMVGHDPFEFENDSDKKYLYNTLINFLDEATLEDPFRLEISIEIVKSFSQIDKINQALSKLTIDINAMVTQSSNIKSLFDTKTKIYSSVLSMAKENGISVTNSNNKSKGAGTLSGIIKKLNELDLNEVKVNLFDIETATAMKQVADISHRSILDQLNFDENDYAEMLKEQKKIIEDMNSKLSKLEEENRILKYNKAMDGE